MATKRNLKGMVHLRTNKKGKVFVTAVGSNGRKLYPTQAFTQKPSAWTNIRSVLDMYNGKSVLVQDNTIKPAVVYLVTETTKKVTNIEPTRKIPTS